MVVVSNRSCNKGRAIITDEDPSNQQFRKALDGWIASAGSNLILWDHTIQHSHLVSPFPNLRTLAPNLRYYRDKGIKQVYAQGYQTEGGEFSELRRYMLAKLLWNPDENTDTLIQHFCQNFYGAAAVPMLNYINLLHTQFEASGETLTSDNHPSQGIRSYLRPEYMDQYNYFYNQAEEIAQNDPQLRDRIKMARLAQAYATLDLARASGTGNKGFYMNVNNKWIVVPGLRTFADNFVSQCERMNVTTLSTSGLILSGAPYVFDARVKVEAPATAENPLNVPVTIDATGLSDVGDPGLCRLQPHSRDPALLSRRNLGLSRLPRQAAAINPGQGRGTHR